MADEAVDDTEPAEAEHPVEVDLERAPTVPLDRVEWRPQGSPYERGNGHVARFVPYVNAAIVADLLDEWVGPARWSDEYTIGQVGKTEVMWCTITVHLVGGRTITKTDLGKASDFESEKGAVSDAFKRAACLKLGVGRNVYDLPILWAPCDKDNKGKARANNDTIPNLQKQLVEMGFEEKAASRTASEEGREGPMPDGVDTSSGGSGGEDDGPVRGKPPKGKSAKGKQMKDPDGEPTNPQKTKLRLMLVEMGVIHTDEDGDLDETIYRAAFEAAYEVNSLAKITKAQASTLIDQLENGNEEKDRSPEDVALALIKTGANYLDAQDETVPEWAIEALKGE